MTDLSDTPAGMISRLDEALGRRGENIVLRRVVKRSGGSVDADVNVRAVVRVVGAEKVVGTITQSDLQVILSPTQIMAAGWPGADDNVVAGDATDRRLPDITDIVVVQGAPRQVKQTRPIFVGGVWVRHELVVAG